MKKIDYEITTCWNLFQRSLILGSFIDYMCRGGYHLRTLVAGIKVLHRIKMSQCIIEEKWTSRKKVSGRFINFA